MLTIRTRFSSGLAGDSTNLIDETLGVAPRPQAIRGIGHRVANLVRRRSHSCVVVAGYSNKERVDEWISRIQFSLREVFPGNRKCGFKLQPGFRCRTRNAVQLTTGDVGGVAHLGLPVVERVAV